LRIDDEEGLLVEYEAPVDENPIIQNDYNDDHYVQVSEVESIHEHNALIIEGKSIYCIRANILMQ
jgi:hypothetical protein